MLKYREVKAALQLFESKDDSNVTISRDFMVELLDEVVKMRRKNIARARQNIVKPKESL